MNKHKRMLSCVVILILILAMPVHSYAEQPDSRLQQTISEASDMYISTTHANLQEETKSGDNLPNNSYRIVANPVIVDDGRHLHQLTDEELSADTITLLQTVLHSEYIRIARASARRLSSNAAPLEVYYSEFNGYLELLTRTDIEYVLLPYIEDASAEELLILDEMLRRSDMQAVLTNAALDRALTLCASNKQNTYAAQPGSEWVEFGDEYGIQIGGKHNFYFSSGESINAYIASREYTTAEQNEVDSYYEGTDLAVTLIYHADISYNCHSYAWYRTDNSNSTCSVCRRMP